MSLALVDLLGPPSRRFTLGRGEFVFHRETEAREIFAVEQGRIRLERMTETGNPVTLTVAVAGDGLAEAALFSERYHCDAIAERSSVVLAFAKGPLLNSLEADPELGLALLERASGQIRYLRALVELRGLRRATDRVLQYLRLREWSPGCSSPERPLKAMAEELGIAPETFYRAIKELRQRGAIVREGRQLRLVRSGAARKN